MDHPIFNCTIYGQPTSKSNRSQVFFNRKIKKPFIHKSKAATTYIKQFHNEVERQKLKPINPIIGDLVLICHIYYMSRRPDLDESQVCDCLQIEGIIENDRQIKEKHIYHHLDKDLPRAIISLYLRD